MEPTHWRFNANKFNSINLNHNWVMGGAKLNEFIFQYADFRNNISSRSSAANELFPNGVTIGDISECGFKYSAVAALAIAARHGFKTSVVKKNGELNRYIARRV